MYMITDSLTCRPQKKPRRSRAPLSLLVPCFLARTRPLLVPPAIHAAQHERAGHAGCVDQRGRLYRQRRRVQEGAASGADHLTPAGQRLKHSRPAACLIIK